MSLRVDMVRHAGIVLFEQTEYLGFYVARRIGFGAVDDIETIVLDKEDSGHMRPGAIISRF